VIVPGFGDLYWSTCVSCAEALIADMQRRPSLEATVQSCVPVICDSFSPRSLASLMCTNRYLRQVCEEARVWGWAIVRLHDTSHHLPKYVERIIIELPAKAAFLLGVHAGGHDRVTKIRDLSMSSCCLEVNEVEGLVTRIPRLERLVLDHNILNIGHVRALARFRQLSVLHLVNCGLNDGSLRALLKGLVCLKELDASTKLHGEDSNVFTHGIFGYLAHTTQLVALKLNHVRRAHDGERVADKLSCLTNLTRLEVPSCAIETGPLGCLTNLICLDIGYHNCMEETALDVLCATLTGLRELDILGMDAGIVEGITHLTALTRLSARGVLMHGVHVTRLLGLQNLSILDLSCVRYVGTLGYVCLSILSSLRLCSLDVSGWFFVRDSRCAPSLLFCGFTHLSRLHMREWDGDDVPDLSGLTMLVELVLSRARGARNATFEQICCLTQLTMLQFSHLAGLVQDRHALAADSVSTLSNLSNLRHLNMSWNPMLEGAHATVLSMLSNLTQLDVSGCGNSWQVLSSISAITNLQELHVHNIKCFLDDNRDMLPVGKFALPEWLLNLPKLVHLGMCDCGFDAGVLEVVSRLTALTRLEIHMNWPLCRDSLVGLTHLHRLRRLSISSTDVACSEKHIRSCITTLSRAWVLPMHEQVLALGWHW